MASTDSRNTGDPVLAYRLPYGVFLHSEWETLRFMAKAGIDQVVVSPMNTDNSLGEAYSGYPPIWKWDRAYDFAILDRQLEDVLANQASAHFWIVVDLNSPRWLARRQSMDSFYQLSHCSLHKEWKEITTDYLAAFLDHCETHWGSRVAGYVIACGRTLEWIEENNFEPSGLKNGGFRRWLRENGLPDMEVPLIGKGLEYRHDDVFDPELEASSLAWIRYVNALTAALAVHFLQRARKRIRKEAGLGMFYPGLLQNSGINGHLDGERVLDEARPDFTIRAICNQPSTIGSNVGANCVTEMLRRRGISQFCECDRITSTSNLRITEFVELDRKGIWSGWKNAAEDVAGLKREIGMALIRRQSFYFFNIWGGSYQGPEVRSFIARAAEVWKRYTKLSTGAKTEILMVIDLESNALVRQGKLFHELFWELERKISRAGLPYDTATTTDLPAMDTSGYKLVIFQNLLAMSDEKQKLLDEKICCCNRTVLLMHRPGLVFNGRYAPENVGRFLGFNPDGPPVASKAFPRWNLLYAPVPALVTPAVLRSAAKRAGAFLACDNGAFLASEEFLMIHKAGSESSLEIRLPFTAGRVTEIFSGTVVSENSGSFTDTFASPDTKIYYLERSSPRGPS